MTDLSNPIQFRRAWQQIVDPATTRRAREKITDPTQIRETFERDELCDNDRHIDLREVQLYRHPDGKHFEVSRVLADGTRVTTSGRWIPADEWAQCTLIAGGVSR